MCSSYIDRNKSNFIKYYQHFKYHIGGGSEDELKIKLNELFEKLIANIEANKDKYTFENLAQMQRRDNVEPFNQKLEEFFKNVYQQDDARKLMAIIRQENIFSNDDNTKNNGIELQNISKKDE